jgi:hypothetical protein
MPEKKKESTIPAATLALYEKLVATNPSIERKGDTVPYTSHNGHMFSYLEKDGSLGLRMPEDAISEFLKKYKTTMFVSYGIVKKEFVLVPDTLLKNTKELKPYFDLSFAYVKSLKPKPSKKAAR